MELIGSLLTDKSKTEMIIELNKKIQVQFDKMCATGKLFRSGVTGQEVWDMYLGSFTKENDPIFRDPESSSHNCNLCKNFVRRYGNIVALDENLKIMTIFDVDAPEEYKDSCTAVSELLKKSAIKNVFFETLEELKALPYESCSASSTQFKLGLDKNAKRYTKEEAEKFGVVKPNQIITFNHLHMFVPAQFVDKSGKSIDALIAGYRDAKNVFKRAMDEISLDTLNLVRDLIKQGSLLDGQTHLHKIEAIIPLKAEYDQLSSEDKDNWCWIKSYKFQYSKFKNELLGVLCTELSEGTELNKACMDWNKRVDPANYMKAVAPITKKQIEEAKKFVEENGYEASFTRRCTTIEDIKASDILHLNSGDGKIAAVSVFDKVKPTSTRHKRSEFDKVEEVPIEVFMRDILPECTSVEAFLLNSHKGNMVTLTTAEDKESKPIFKWRNNYSWTYNGNLAGKSQIKEAVKSAGGFVDAPFRFSIMWNEDGRDIVDLDAHAYEPDGTHIYYRSFKGRQTNMSGSLDIDMIRPKKVGVENIFWTDTSRLRDGIYKFKIHNYDGNRNKGCKAEIAFGESTWSYLIDKEIKGTIDIAQVTIKNGDLVDIQHYANLVDSNEKSTELYGLETNHFHKVNLVCLSPNHWSDSIGNKHYFFMLEGCKSPSEIRGFHNENLTPELLQHRKVMEVLGATLQVESTDKQLSGLGFNATVRDEVVLRLKGSFNRVIKVKF